MQPPHTTASCNPCLRVRRLFEVQPPPCKQSHHPACTPRIDRSPKIHIRRLIFSLNYSQISTLYFTITIVKSSCHFATEPAYLAPLIQTVASSIFVSTKKTLTIRESSHMVWCRMRSIQSSRHPYTRTYLSTQLYLFLHKDSSWCSVTQSLFIQW